MRAKGKAAWRLGRRRVLQGLAAAGALAAVPACARRAAPKVVIVGGGFGGATCARYLKLLDPGIEVTLVERNETYVTCPFSNNVLGGLRTLDSLTHRYDGLARFGIEVMRDFAAAVEGPTRKIRLASGAELAYDRLVLSPGIDILWGAIEGYDEKAAEIMPHAWKAGPQTALLRRQIEAMEDGGLVVIAAPHNPYRCPPAPYERACMIAHHLKAGGKARSKILILDAKDQFTKQELFEEGWKRFYAGMIEWIPGSKGGEVRRADPSTRTLHAAEAVKADVANVVPPQQAGLIAQAAGVAGEDGWCEIDPATMESRLRAGIHVIGDSCVAGAMPKSGFSANSQAKACAAALVALLRERPVEEPVFMNTCYSTIAPDYAVSINGAYRKSPSGAIVAVMGSGGQSPVGAPDSVRKAEFRYAEGWYASTMAEMFG